MLVLRFQSERCEMKVDSVSCLKLEPKDNDVVELIFPDIDREQWLKSELAKLRKKRTGTK